MSKKIASIIILFFLGINTIYCADLISATAKPAAGKDLNAGYLSVELNNIENPALPKAPRISDTILRLFISLLGILGLFYLLAVIGKRFYLRASIPLKSEGVLKILAKEYIDTKTAVYFIEAADRILILGSTGNNLNTLAEITDKDTIEKVRLQSDEYIAKYRMKSETKFSDELKAGYAKQGKKLVDAGNQAVKNIMEKFGKKP
jgi:flagellar biogenesis protein FliO